jgi:hypothetical protein
MIRRFLKTFLLYGLFFGIVIGGINLLIDVLIHFELAYEHEKNKYALETVGVLAGLVAIISAFRGEDVDDSMFGVLCEDYPGEAPKSERVPSSEGLLLSSNGLERTLAKSYADECGIRLYKKRTRRSLKDWAKVPWDRISSIEVVEPDQSNLDGRNSLEQRNILSSRLNAKLVLKRTRGSLTLVVPWNEKFSSYVPSDIEIVKNWRWKSM